VDDSNIAANAVTGDGGNIKITTREIFGLAFRDIPSPESSDITASSEFGVSGTVSIDGFSVDADAGLVNLPTEVTDESDRIVQGCGVDESSQFIASGRGGFSAAPADDIPAVRIWRDVRSPNVDTGDLDQTIVRAIDLSVNTNPVNTNPVDTEPVDTEPPLVEAMGFEKRQGEVVLVAENAQAIATDPPTCLH